MPTTLTPAPTASIFIPKGAIVGYSFKASGKPAVTGTVELVGDCYITEARREEDGSWSYELAPGRTYYCAGGLATVTSGGCPAPSHFSPSDDRYNTKLITTADCGWCGEPVVVRS